MTCATEKKPLDKKSLSYLPEEIVLPKTNEKIVLDFFKESDYEEVYYMLKDVVDEGLTYPLETLDTDEFEKFYLSHTTFVVRHCNGSVLGSFYIKPYFPGRGSHICRGGFLVNKKHRRKGIGGTLYKKYLSIARDLGYKGSFFYVTETNEVSMKISRKLGFFETGRVPKGFKARGIGYVDVLQFYYDLTTLNKD